MKLFFFTYKQGHCTDLSPISQILLDTLFVYGLPMCLVSKQPHLCVSLLQENLRDNGPHGHGPVAHSHHLPHCGLRGCVAQHHLRKGSVSLHRSHGERVWVVLFEKYKPNEKRDKMHRTPKCMFECMLMHLIYLISGGGFCCPYFNKYNFIQVTGVQSDENW